MSRILAGNFEDALRAKLVNSTIANESLHSRIFYFGQVISNSDPKNLNRIKIRIPTIDDVFYVGKTKDEGDASLPWSLPISHRFIDIPEVNTIIIVAIFDTKTPYYGRVYFDTVTEVSSTDIFNRVTPEINSLSTWENVETAYNININKPKPNAYDAKQNVIYNTGIRGKGKNKILFAKDFTLWIQNEGDSQNESSIKQSQNIDIDSSDLINITSKKGGTRYHPIFHTPLYNYLSIMNQTIQKIIILLNTIPAKSPSGACIPGPNAKQLINQLQKMSSEFSKFRNIGNSKKITIN